MTTVAGNRGGASAVCECGRPQGQCVKGELVLCPDIMDEMMGASEECDRCGEINCICYDDGP
jgi:hypothetical protein